MSPDTSFERARASLADKPHGTHARYVSGCHCFHCRVAHSQYNVERERAKAAGDFNGIVDATPVREHLRMLSRQGVGYKSVADAAGVSKTILSNILAGRRTRVRARTMRAVLAVDKSAIADHALVPSGPTWRLLDELLERGFSKAQLARWMGSKTPAIQFKRGGLILARTASRVERMYRMVNDGRLYRGQGKAALAGEAVA
jgi:transcriptional regulator with XRE-family HTH domain